MSTMPSALLQQHGLRLEIEAFNAAYCHTLDEGDLQDWPEFFTEDGFYSVTARENFEAALPVGLIYCEGKAMLKDRAYAIANTAMFAPRYLRHVVSNTRIVAAEGETVRAASTYLLLQTLHDEAKVTIHQSGVYHDQFVRGDDSGLLLRRRVCVYDNLLVPNALVLPV